MTDLRVLNDAFAELERRADAASQPAFHQRPRVRRLVPVAATVAVVAGLAAGTVWLVPGGDGGTPAAAGSPTTSESTDTSSVAASAELPRNPEELIARFTDVLGDTATFDVTDSGPAVVIQTAPPSPEGPSGDGPSAPIESEGRTSGGAIAGTLTASGVTGGFDLLVYRPEAGDPRSECQRECETLPDGSTLYVDEYELDGSTGVTREVTVYRADGAILNMHVSSERSPKGHSEVVAPQPPLTTDQMVTILTSDLW